MIIIQLISIVRCIVTVLYVQLLFLCLASLVSGVVAQMLVVRVHLLELVQLRHARLHLALHHFQQIQILVVVIRINNAKQIRNIFD